MKIMIHVDKTSSASITLTLHCQTIDILMSLKHGNSLLLIGEFKMGKQVDSQGYGKSKMAAWFFLAPWQTSFLFVGIKHSKLLQG